MPQLLSNAPLLIEQEKLPSLPNSLLKLLEAVRDPDADFSYISQIIQTDPALTSRFMAAANSGANFQLSKNNDFNSMVVSLGLKTVKNIACHSAVQQFFSQFNIDKENALASFWSRSLMTANLARSLARLTSYDNEDEVYIAGLLHNLGELVCLAHDADAYVQLGKKISRSKKTLKDKEALLSEMEYDFVGAAIPEIGAAMIQDFDPLLSDAILYQRETAAQLPGTSHLIKLINAAHKLSLLSKNSDPQGVDYVFAEVSAIFDLGQSLLEKIRLTSQAEVLETAKTMGLTISADETMSIDESLQVELADNVRIIALSNSLQEINNVEVGSRSEQLLLKQIIQNLNILFGLSHCIYLAFDEQSRQLIAQYSDYIDKQQLSQFNIPLKAVSSLPVRSLIKQVPMLSAKLVSENSPDNNSDNINPSVVDRQLARLLDSEEILCVPLLDRNDNSSAAVHSEFYGVLVAGFSSAQIEKIRREKGLLYEFSLSSSQVIFRDRNTARQINAIVEDEQALHALQIRKLVHEANNPLGIIRNYLQVLAHKLEGSDDEKLPGQLDILMQEVERVGSIVLRIRETPQQSSSADHQANINELIERLGSIFKQSLFLKAGINVKFQFDKNIPLIETNIHSINQILTNLFKNAAEAMPDGGELHVNTRDQVNYNGQQYVEISISDNGPGIPNEILDNLFNPVKSTKSGEHSGLGLSIIKNLVNDLGGTISGSNGALNGSANKGGAVFVILLPRNIISE